MKETKYDSSYEICEDILDALNNPEDVNVDPTLITRNGTYTASPGRAYNPVKVNVTSNGKVIPKGTKFSACKTQLPDDLDWSQIDDMEYFFDFAVMKETPKMNNLGKVTTVNNMFRNSEFEIIHTFDTSNVTDAVFFLDDSETLTTIEELDFSKTHYNQSGFGLVLGFDGNFPKLVNVGGFKNIHLNMNFGGAINISHQSMLNIINKVGKVWTPLKIKFPAAKVAELTEDEIAIATAKNWSIITP